jgi:hypothetical protein
MALRVCVLVFASLLSEADATLGSPALAVSTDRGLLHAMTPLPSAVGVRKLPDGQTLTDVLTPELYARWSELKAEYLGRNRAVERWRPVLGAEKLHNKAFERAGLSFNSPVAEHIRKAGKQRDLPQIDASFVLTLDEPNQP